MLNTNKLLARDLKKLYGVSGSTINKWIMQGTFPTAKKVPGRGGNGLVWAVDINDKNISPDIRALWRKLVENTRGLETPETGMPALIKAVKRTNQGMRAVTAILTDIRELLKDRK
jgi:hypothetical protein